MARRPEEAGPTLTTRVVIASGLLALLGVAIFVVLLLAINRQRCLITSIRQSRTV